MDAFKLPMQFDVAKLLADLEHVELQANWLSHTDYTVVGQLGDWTAIPLIAPPAADVSKAESLRYRGRIGAATEILKQCPYLQSVIASFQTEVHRVRLMNLRPGKVIARHRDYGTQRYSLNRGYIRVHIPLRTHPDVKFFINDNALPLQAGEAWYTNVCELHNVRNDSDVQRVHMVLDMKVNDWLLGMFPAQSLLNRVHGAVLRRYERRFITARFAARDWYQNARKRAGDMGLRRLKGLLT